ncbi:MAG: biotin/lipoyl-containing protein [Anaerolineae bacterium]
MIGDLKPVDYVATLAGEKYRIRIDQNGGVVVNDLPRTTHLESINESLYSLLIGSKSYEILVEPGEDRYTVIVEGNRYEVQVSGEQAPPMVRREDRKRSEARAIPATTLGEPMGQPREGAGAGAVTSPMTGVLVEFLVEEGKRVKAGEGVAILEAMKTRNVIRAPRDGIVKKIRVAVGQTVRMDHVIMEVDPLAGN